MNKNFNQERTTNEINYKMKNKQKIFNYVFEYLINERMEEYNRRMYTTPDFL